MQKAQVWGMHEDWFWTVERVYEDGKFITELNEDTEIGGINGSSWATPTLQLYFKDGTEKMIEVSAGQNDNEKPSWFQLGVLSQSCQDNITPLEQYCTQRKKYWRSCALTTKKFKNENKFRKLPKK